MPEWISFANIRLKNSVFSESYLEKAINDSDSKN